MRLALIALLALATINAQQQHPRDKEIHDPTTRAWWHTTEDLSSDAMEGRDTGSVAYNRAADYVVNRFRQAGLQPAGDAGTFLQSVPMHEVAADPDHTTFTILPATGPAVPLKFLQQVSLAPDTNLPSEFTAPLTFRGYCGPETMQNIAGKIVVCFANRRQGLPNAADRTTNARKGEAFGLLNVDDPYFSIEPSRWPAAYARRVALGPAPTDKSKPFFVMTLSAELFPTLIAGTSQNAPAILSAGGHKESLPSFEIPAQLQVHVQLTQRTYNSPNVLAQLPGSDPTLKNEYIVIAAHLDGYGYGTPVNADNLYNGALDDAAYVALLIQFADDLHRTHQSLKRSILFCGFTGEEKGLLGANYFVEHPTIPLAQLAADVNLDQLRPLFPLRILTALAIDDTTLGDTARQIGSTMGIELRPDREPERALLRRADHYPFLHAGIPAIGFIFGYDPGTDAERRYREWYQIRYHRPQDDLKQPLDFDAATKFNSFFYRLIENLADAPTRPSFKRTQ